MVQRRWLRVAALVVALIGVFAPDRTLAQGGPPMITDGPGTPGNRKWEINLAVAFERRRSGTLVNAPAIDLNSESGSTFSSRSKADRYSRNEADVA